MIKALKLLHDIVAKPQNFLDESPTSRNGILNYLQHHLESQFDIVKIHDNPDEYDDTLITVKSGKKGACMHVYIYQNKRLVFGKIQGPKPYKYNFMRQTDLQLFASKIAARLNAGIDMHKKQRKVER